MPILFPQCKSIGKEPKQNIDLLLHDYCKLKIMHIKYVQSSSITLINIIFMITVN